METANLSRYYQYFLPGRRVWLRARAYTTDQYWDTGIHSISPGESGTVEAVGPLQKDSQGGNFIISVKMDGSPGTHELSGLWFEPARPTKHHVREWLAHV